MESLTPIGYDLKARHALSALGRKPYFNFLCCLCLSTLPPPCLPLVSSQSVMTFKLRLRCLTADPSIVKSVASGRQMAEGEAQHLWFLKVSALSLLTPASQPQAELWSHRCYLQEGQPSDASTLPICPALFPSVGWNGASVLVQTGNLFGFRTCHRQSFLKCVAWNQNFKICCKSHLLLQGIPRYVFSKGENPLIRSLPQAVSP